MRFTLEMDPTARMEIGFGRVLAGREQWMYGEYFPKAGPLMARHGLRPVVAFAVVDSNADIAPVEGSLSSWPSAANRAELFADPEFTAWLPERDAGLFLSDGHLFEPLPGAVEVDGEGEYAIIVAERGVAPDDALFRVPLASDSAIRTYDGQILSLHPWTDTCATLMSDRTAATVLRVRLNNPMQA